MKSSITLIGLGTLCLSASGNALATAADEAFAPALQATTSDGDGAAAKPYDPSLAAVIRRWADEGVFLRANLINQYAENTTGGVDQDGSNVGQFNFGADLDLDKLWGVRGGSFHVTVYRDYGHGLNHDTTGTFTKQQNIYKNEYNHLHLGLFAYEQKLMDNRLDLVVGRLGTTSYYGKLSANCQFQAATTCGLPRLINAEAGFSLLPSATWGINVLFKPTPHTYVETGVFEVNPTSAPSNGADFSIAEATGVTVPVEWGWTRTDPKEDPHTFALKFGGYVSTPPYNDPFYNTAGRSRGLYGGTARCGDANRPGIYAMGERVVWRPTPTSTRALNLFGGISQQLEVQEIMRQQIYGGLVLTGPFAARPQDTLGFQVSYFDMTDKEVAYLRDARIRAGGQGSNDPNQYAFELNYGWHPTRGVTVMPNLQYIVHPDNSALPNTAVLPRNMFAFGLNVQLNFGSMIGLKRDSSGD